MGKVEPAEVEDQPSSPAGVTLGNSACADGFKEYASREKAYIELSMSEDVWYIMVEFSASSV